MRNLPDCTLCCRNCFTEREILYSSSFTQFCYLCSDCVCMLSITCAFSTIQIESP